MKKRTFVRSHIDSVEFSLPASFDEFEDYPNIINYVSTVCLGVKFDLNSITCYIASADRKPRRFAATTIRIFPSTGLLFSTGKMVISGPKTKYGSILAGHSYRLILEQIPQAFYNTKLKKFYFTRTEKFTSFKDFKVENVVGSGKLFDMKGINSKYVDELSSKIGLVDLDSFARNNIVSAGWDKEIFPGMRFNMEEFSLTAHVFEAANDVLMGAKNKEGIYKGHNHLKKIIAPYSNTLENTGESLEKKTKIVETLIKTKFAINKPTQKIPMAKKKSNKKQRLDDKEEDPYEKHMKTLFEFGSEEKEPEILDLGSTFIKGIEDEFSFS